MRQKAITERVKFLIKHIIGKGIASNQEELGKLLGVNNKSYFSQLISGQRNNENLINSLLNFAPNFNKEWLYNEAIDTPFSNEITVVDIGGASVDMVLPETKIQQLENTLELMKKDVKYYADIADSRLTTIGVQNALIEKLEKLIDILEKQK